MVSVKSTRCDVRPAVSGPYADIERYKTPTLKSQHGQAVNRLVRKSQMDNNLPYAWIRGANHKTKTEQDTITRTETGTFKEWPDHITMAFGWEAGTVQVSGHIYVVSNDDMVPGAVNVSLGYHQADDSSEKSPEPEVPPLGVKDDGAVWGVTEATERDEAPAKIRMAKKTPTPVPNEFGGFLDNVHAMDELDLPWDSDMFSSLGVRLSV